MVGELVLKDNCTTQDISWAWPLSYYYLPRHHGVLLSTRIDQIHSGPVLQGEREAVAGL